MKRTAGQGIEALRARCYFLFSGKVSSLDGSNIFAELRKMENGLQALLTVEKHDATLAEVGESIRTEISNRRRRYGRNNAVEEKMLVSVLEFIK